MISILFWASFGAIVGWVAAILNDDTQTKAILHVVIGTIGGLAGGVTGALLDPQSIQATNTDSMFAIFGAVIFVGILSFLRQRTPR